MNIEQLQLEVERIIKDVEGGGNKPSNVPSPEVHYNCPRCGEWYSEHTAPIGTLDIVDDKVQETLFCNCHGENTELRCAHSYNFNSPYMTWQKEELEKLRYYLEEAETQVSKYLNNYLHRD